MLDKRNSIQTAIRAFSIVPFGKQAIELLGCLGYQSDRRVNLGDSSPDTFMQFVQAMDEPGMFNESKALCDQWQSADLLFQLTDQELSKQRALFDDNEISPSLLRSYLFFAIELSGENYARGKLTDIARQINRVFPMPVMVILKHQSQKQPVISIAVINRRQNKVDKSKDVLGKVTIIRDISIDEPHRGHLDILNSIVFENLEHPQRLAVNNFDNLHAAWEEIFNVELLNQKFYDELSNWYYWAKPQVEFPDDIEKDKEVRRATSLIRLLTRLIFCWFLKEKGLIPEYLFNEADVQEVLVDLDKDSCTYHQAILQNLFFGTLNQRMGVDQKTKEPFRQFAKLENDPKNLFRYEEHFREKDSAIENFAEIPFLNGGLFECLDRQDKETRTKTYIDGFSRNKDKRAIVPNELFFSDWQTDTDSPDSDAYGNRSVRNQKVRGLIRILSSYKFTIIENTPIDQEIALDPELLGKVFENLLASYNEETRRSARKQTGSYYTPRTIVEYMVDESLKAHLSNVLIQTGTCKDDAMSGLENLFAYTEQPHLFTGKQVDTLLDAIHNCKILDPACGSGAFPMGMLQKLVFIIHKLDPDNSKWMQLQIEKASEIPDSTARNTAIKAIERKFHENNYDYGRKLYLIENCLYGVDIQPIAIQISKLRFFISLVCDQKMNRRKKDNLRIEPLPNLETKFIAANTLIGIPEIRQLELAPRRVYDIEEDIESLYHNYFGIQRRDQKLGLQNKIQELRRELANLLFESLKVPTKAKFIADWDPFNTQKSAGFFNAHWMFGRSLKDGFDIVIGNPPYFKENDDKERFNGLRSLECYQGKMDVWYLFVDVGVNLLKENGLLTFIATNNWITNAGASKIRNKILRETVLMSLIDFRDYMIFDSANIQTMVMTLRKNKFPEEYQSRISRVESGFSRSDISLLKSGRLSDIKTLNTFDFPIARKEALNKPILFKTGSEAAVLKLYSCGAKVYLKKNEISQGIAPNPDRINSRNIRHFGKGIADQRGIKVGDGVFVLSRDEQSAIAENERKYLKPLYGPTQVNRYFLRPSEWQIIYSKRGSFDPNEAPSILRHLAKYREIMEARRENKLGRIEYFNLHWPRDETNFKEGEKILAPRKCATPTFLYLKEAAYVMLSMNVLKTSRLDMRYLSALLNSSTIYYWLKHEGNLQGTNFQIDAGPLQRIPLSNIDRNTQSSVGTIVELIQLARRAENEKFNSVAQFFEDLIDACVMECYFREHMAERDLLFLNNLVPHLARYEAMPSPKKRTEFLEMLYCTLNASDSPIRNRLIRLTADSPNLLAVIKNEAKK